jgi:hypothetical protein
MSSRANGIATGRSAGLTNAEHVTQVGEILRSEPNWHIAQDNNAVRVSQFKCDNYTRSNALKQLAAVSCSMTLRLGAKPRQALLIAVPCVPIDSASHIHHNCEHDEERNRAHQQGIVLLAQRDVEEEINTRQTGADH